MKLKPIEKLLLIRNRLAQNNDDFKEIGIGAQTDDNFDMFRPRVASSPPPLKKLKLFKDNSAQANLSDERPNEDTSSSMLQQSNSNEQSASSVKPTPRKIDFLPSSEEEIIEVNSSKESGETSKSSSEVYQSYDNFDKIDLEAEKQSFLNALKTATNDDDIDMRNFSFRNMSNPLNSMVYAQDLRTGTEYLIPKPTAFREDLEKKRKRGDIPKKRDSPKRTRSKTHIEKALSRRQSNTFKPQWDSYEKWRLV